MILNIDYDNNQIIKFLKGEYKLGFLKNPLLLGTKKMIYERLKLLVQIKYSDIYFELLDESINSIILFRKKNLKEMIIFINIYNLFKNEKNELDKFWHIPYLWNLIDYSPSIIKKKLIFLLIILYYNLNYYKLDVNNFDYKTIKEKLKSNKEFQKLKKEFLNQKLKKKYTKIDNKILNEWKEKIKLGNKSFKCFCMNSLIDKLKDDTIKNEFKIKIFKYEKKYINNYNG